MLLDSPREVVRCLITYPDWYQPTTSSVMKVGAARPDKTIGDGLRAGLIETLEERTELSRRMRKLRERDRDVLFLWYVKQLHVDDIAALVGVSRRQCFRRRGQAIRQVVTLGESS